MTWCSSCEKIEFLRLWVVEKKLRLALALPRSHHVNILGIIGYELETSEATTVQSRLDESSLLVLAAANELAASVRAFSCLYILEWG